VKSFPSAVKFGAANVPLKVVKRQKKKQILQVHMKPRGLDSCSYADLGTESAASPGKCVLTDR